MVNFEYVNAGWNLINPLNIDITYVNQIDSS